MAVYIGDKKISKVSLGGVGIREAYVGNTCVYKTEVVRTYGIPTITEFYYPSLSYQEGSTVKPVISFMQDWTDNFGNSVTLYHDTTPYTAEYSVYRPSGGDDNTNYEFGEDGEVIAKNTNTVGIDVSVGWVMMTLTANGMTNTAVTEVMQHSRPAITDPVVALSQSLYQENSGSSTKKVYFNVDITRNSAESVVPKYFLANGEKFEVTAEECTHSVDRSDLTTSYWADLSYNEMSSYTFRLYSEFTFQGTEDWDRYTTYTEEISSTNYLAINGDNDFYVR